MAILRSLAVFGLTLAIVIFAPCLAAPAHADPFTGSWTKSCRDRQIIASTHKIVGVCGNGNGGSRHTTLIRYDLCSGDIYNDHGHLKCDRFPKFRWSVPASASLSCFNSFQVDNVFWAKCKEKGEHWDWTSVPKQTCNSAINNNGVLSCSASPPPGPWLQPGEQTYHLCAWVNGDQIASGFASGDSLQAAILAFETDARLDISNPALFVAQC